jgi:hypothetical protein
MAPRRAGSRRPRSTSTRPARQRQGAWTAGSDAASVDVGARPTIRWRRRPSRALRRPRRYPAAVTRYQQRRSSRARRRIRTRSGARASAAAPASRGRRRSRRTTWCSSRSSRRDAGGEAPARRRPPARVHEGGVFQCGDADDGVDHADDAEPAAHRRQRDRPDPAARRLGLGPLRRRPADRRARSPAGGRRAAPSAATAARISPCSPRISSTATRSSTGTTRRRRTRSSTPCAPTACCSGSRTCASTSSGPGIGTTPTAPSSACASCRRPRGCGVRRRPAHDQWRDEAVHRAVRVPVLHRPGDAFFVDCGLTYDGRNSTARRR